MKKWTVLVGLTFWVGMVWGQVMEHTFAGMDFVSDLDAATRDELLMLRSRYISARREYHTGKIKSSDFHHERQGVAEGLLDLIKRLFIK